MKQRQLRAGLAALMFGTAIIGALGSATDPLPVYTPPPVNTTSPGSGGVLAAPVAPAASQGRLGIALNNLSPQDQAFYKRQTGAVIEAVAPASLAERSGFRRNDLIIAIDKNAVSGASDVINAVTNAPAGQRLSFTIIRNGKEQQLDVSF
ncbi:PDZ domain-containing protein [Permianibacter aggregans]|uniref:PDZ domain-containing protein n=1 Tax=Permianibacter aggregans TaxID=1510150 RepID=A0A4R6UWN1_9GAMM|nr:PDZ domain-containing protein [Permianibacter aggregans]TDQ49945.1 PDZ domain-containing protein [Permianibacter aggregans]